ncbi:hypothetical protein [Salinimicrobium sp. GXAS 041]|uniref:hypothetical protein n=1 Tax=Salinimicrobium sp. GXAS 041 TaxID=3400806 RepID=UPI003C742BD4
MKNLFFACFLLVFGHCVGQTSGRIEIQGEIMVPPGFEAEGITIYNENANRGAVSGEKGAFNLPVKEGDSLRFSAVHFQQLLVVVSRKIVESGNLVVEISEEINELPEIVIRPHNLSGVITEDLKKIEVEEIQSSQFVYKNVKDLHFAPDSQTVPKNAALGETGAMAPASLDILAILGLVRHLFPKKTKKEEVKISYDFLDRELRRRYPDEFFKSTLELKSEEINDFIFFAEENGLNAQLMQKEKEMDLLQFLIEQSKVYNQRKLGE